MKKQIKTVDLFSGCGGMSLGFQQAGFNVIAAFDNWQPAVDVYRKNFKHPIDNLDLADLDAIIKIKSLNPDIIIGGPPCQDFSIAGKRNLNGQRGNLTMSFSSIICSILPRYFVMENVYNIQKFPILQEVISKFKQAGYGITQGVFDASLMGVPQARKRYFLIGKLGAEHDFLQKLLQENLANKAMTVRDYFGEKLETDYYYMHPRSYQRRAIYSIDEPSSTIRGVNRPIPNTYVPHPADKTHLMGNVRSLTFKERSLIQTFPEWFKFEGNKSVIEQMIGNAVPIKMAEYIASYIYQDY